MLSPPGSISTSRGSDILGDLEELDFDCVREMIVNAGSILEKI